MMSYNIWLFHRHSQSVSVTSLKVPSCAKSYINVMNDTINDPDEIAYFTLVQATFRRTDQESSNCIPILTETDSTIQKPTMENYFRPHE